MGRALQYNAAVCCNITPPFQAWLKRLLPSSTRSIQSITRWRVSQLDGTHMHDIGRATLIPNPRWTPDGKHVSFIRKSVLYMVPVD